MLLNRTSIETKHEGEANKEPANSGESDTPPLTRGRLDGTATFKRVERIHVQLKPTSTTSQRSANENTPTISSESPPKVSLQMKRSRLRIVKALRRIDTGDQTGNSIRESSPKKYSIAWAPNQPFVPIHFRYQVTIESILFYTPLITPLG